MKHTTDEIVRMVSGSYAKKFDWIDRRDLAQEIHLKILHGKKHTYDPSRGDFEPYARAIANRTAHAYVFAIRCPAHGRVADLKKWKNIRAIPIGELSEDDSRGGRNIPFEPQSLDPSVDDKLRAAEIVECLQQIFEANREDGELARGILLENMSAEDVAEAHNVPAWRVYRATYRIRRAIKMNSRARLLWGIK
jgi:RNA polymerase sigma factor (sigma-70 family)